MAVPYNVMVSLRAMMYEFYCSNNEIRKTQSNSSRFYIMLMSKNRTSLSNHECETKFRYALT